MNNDNRPPACLSELRFDQKHVYNKQWPNKDCSKCQNNNMSVKLLHSSTLTAIRHLMIAVAVLHASLGETPQLQVTYSSNGMDDKVSLGCRERPSGLLRSGATYTFKEPGTGRTENSVVAVGSQSYTFTINPSNESLVTCTLDSGESDPVKVAGI